MICLIGRKIGMIHIYDKLCNLIPVTLVSIFNCYVSEVFKVFNKFTFFILSYFFNNIFLKSKIFSKNFKVSFYDFLQFNLNDHLPLNIFFINQSVNVFGITIGKGFSGVIKRHNFKSNNKSHGNSKSHNKPGSIGMCQDPGRVYPGKKLPGRLGGKKSFLKNSKILKIDFFYNIFYLKGNIPGFNNSNVIISPNIL
ncbi:MAG: 50S ribosomal protein L3 [Candidatus Nasuia deltocephalinicola]